MLPILAQVDAAAKKVTLSWEVTGATLAAGAGSNGVGATTVVFAPLQGFFGVSSPSQLDIQVRDLHHPPAVPQWHAPAILYCVTCALPR